MPDFAAVLFDLDGTLCESTQSETTIYEGAFAYAGANPVGTPGDLWAALDGPPDPQDERGYLAAGFERVLRAHGRPEAADPDALAAGFLDTVEHGAVAFLPGAEGALTAAGDAGPTGLVTNGPEHRQAPKVETLALAEVMDTLVYAGDMARRKPHPDPFERATDELGVAPERTLYVGNSVEFDVAGAHAAGLSAAWLRSRADETPDALAEADHDPEFVLETLADLREVLGRD